jgi:uncharacterized protein (DUF983 family)
MSRMPSAPVLLFRGMTKRCPWCGRGRLFRRWFGIAERCPRCGLRFEREEGAFLGSLALNYGVTGLAFIGLLVGWLVVTLPDVRWGLLLVVSIGVAIGVPLLFYPFAKTIWSAIDLMLHRADRRDPEWVTGTFGIHPEFVEGDRGPST